MQKTFITLFCACILCSSYALAQKLPDTQDRTIIAPANVRIDGKNNEWNTFAAFNKRLDVYYTLASDSKYLYLALKAEDNGVITKILAGGITFTINSKGKKVEENAQSLTYPLVKRNVGAMGGMQGRARQSQSVLTQEQRDSMQLAQRTSQLASVKEIEVRGFTAISDTLISIYNTYGVKAIGRIDNQNAFFCEIAIPLELLQLPANKPFAYQLKLNGRSRNGGGGMMAMRMGSGNRSGFGGGNMTQQDLWSATDFWAKCQLQILP